MGIKFRYNLNVLEFGVNNNRTRATYPNAIATVMIDKF